MKEVFHMAKIISILLISYLGWKLTGYDFFVLSALISFALDIYSSMIDLQKRLYKYTKDKTAKR